jgi:hypothetical protein
MFHANTRRLIGDWQELKADRLAPARTDIQPADFREILTQLFILGGDGPAADTFRLAGGLLFDLHARELRGLSFLGLWPYPDRSAVAKALADARANGRPVILEASAWTAEGYEASLEIVLAPLADAHGAIDRVLGLYQPTSSLRGLLGRPVVDLTLHAVKGPAGAVEPRPSRLRLAAVDGERLA